MIYSVGYSHKNMVSVQYARAVIFCCASKVLSLFSAFSMRLDEAPKYGNGVNTFHIIIRLHVTFENGVFRFSQKDER